MTASTAAVPTTSPIRDFLAGATIPLEAAMAETAAALPETGEAADTACPEDIALAAGADPESGAAALGPLGCESEAGAAATERELDAAARPLVVSRFSRCKSARISAALW